MIRCTPISKNKLKSIAVEFRKRFHVECLAFPVLDIIEDLHCTGLLNLQIVEDADLKLTKDQLALYELKTNTMYVKLSVYNEALNNIGRSRFTLAHELSHYLLLYVLKFDVEETEVDVKPYEDPEWQANYLAGELLAPSQETVDFSVDNYMEKCLLSEECAIVLKKKREKKN